MDVSRSAPTQLTTMRALFTCSLNWELRREHGVYDIPGEGSTNSVLDEQSLIRCTTHLYILHQICDNHRVDAGVHEVSDITTGGADLLVTCVQTQLYVHVTKFIITLRS